MSAAGSAATRPGATASGVIEPARPLFYPVRHVARLTVQAVTPLSASSGEIDADTDAPLFRDWNGLPCLSAAGIAGVLRSLYFDHFGEAATQALFGYVEPGTQKGKASRLMVSFGLVHDSAGKPVGTYLSEERRNDQVLALLLRRGPVDRQHVAIDKMGVAEEHKLFDRVSCPAGARFSVELSIDGETAGGDERRELENVVRMFGVSYARFGAAGRRGLGRLKIVEAHIAAIDRRGSAGRDRWLAYRRANLHEAPAAACFRQMTDAELALPEDVISCRAPVAARIRLTPKFLWRMGQSGELWLPPPEADKAADVAPPVEPKIVWSGDGKASVHEGPALNAGPGARLFVPIPGAGVKGPLAHRTEFHLRRLKGRFADGAPDDERLSDCLFGSMREEHRGFAGALMIDDAFLDFGKVAEEKEHVGRRTRNSIDRHTGGVRLGPLFTDEALWKAPDELVIDVTILGCVPTGVKNTLEAVDEKALKAFAWALEDLCEGRLALGAREGTGDGAFENGVVESPNGKGIEALLASLAEAIDAAKRRAAEGETRSARDADEPSGGDQRERAA
jgi:CRISPR/Cas system CSM-associated protein Csm3 (group 7 of RAMP superfamily)